jgi:hypothetical protein
VSPDRPCPVRWLLAQVPSRAAWVLSHGVNNCMPIASCATIFTGSSRRLMPTWYYGGTLSRRKSGLNGQFLPVFWPFWHGAGETG